MGGSGGIVPHILDGGEWSASRLDRFTPPEKETGTYCIEE